MPLLLEKQIDAAKKIGVWDITEPLSFFEENTGIELAEGITLKRRTEQLVASHLLNTLAGQRIHTYLDKTVTGKPILKGMNASVSFSHSRHLIACIFDLEGKEVGIDIEKLRENILNLKHKFVKETDSSPFQDPVLNGHLIWGAKEVLYKIYSMKELDFLSHLSVEFRDQLIGKINKNEFKRSYLLEYQLLEDFLLVWNI